MEARQILALKVHVRAVVPARELANAQIITMHDSMNLDGEWLGG